LDVGPEPKTLTDTCELWLERSEDE